MNDPKVSSLTNLVDTYIVFRRSAWYENMWSMNKMIAALSTIDYDKLDQDEKKLYCNIAYKLLLCITESIIYRQAERADWYKSGRKFVLKAIKTFCESRFPCFSNPQLVFCDKMIIEQNDNKPGNMFNNNKLSPNAVAMMPFCVSVEMSIPDKVSVFTRILPKPEFRHMLERDDIMENRDYRSSFNSQVSEPLDFDIHTITEDQFNAYKAEMAKELASEKTMY